MLLPVANHARGSMIADEWGKLVHGDRQYDIACRVRYAKRPLRTHAPETMNSS
jgi:hypothetical protein